MSATGERTSQAHNYNENFLRHCENLIGTICTFVLNRFGVLCVWCDGFLTSKKKSEMEIHNWDFSMVPVDSVRLLQFGCGASFSF